MERAAEWICTHPDDTNEMEVDVSASSESTPAPGLHLPDGPGSKFLTLLVSISLESACSEVLSYIAALLMWMDVSFSRTSVLY